jgi:Zn-dependent alcohol dehydrogenase
MNAPLSIEEVKVDSPKAGEVWIKVNTNESFRQDQVWTGGMAIDLRSVL